MPTPWSELSPEAKRRRNDAKRARKDDPVTGQAYRDKQREWNKSYSKRKALQDLVTLELARGKLTNSQMMRMFRISYADLQRIKNGLPPKNVPDQVMI